MNRLTWINRLIKNNAKRERHLYKITIQLQPGLEMVLFSLTV